MATDVIPDHATVPDTGPAKRLRRLFCTSYAMVLLLGLLPWLNVRCEGQPLCTQTGYQIALGRRTLTNPELMTPKLRYPDGSILEPVQPAGFSFYFSRTGILDPQDNLPRSLQVCGFFLLIASGLFFGLFLRSTQRVIPTLFVFSVLALSALLSQFVLGFPTEQAAASVNSLVTSQGGSLSQFEVLDPTMGGVAPRKGYEIGYSPWLWVTLAVTAFPLMAVLLVELRRKRGRVAG